MQFKENRVFKVLQKSKPFKPFIVHSCCLLSIASCGFEKKNTSKNRLLLKLLLLLRLRTVPDCGAAVDYAALLKKKRKKKQSTQRNREQ